MTDTPVNDIAGPTATGRSSGGRPTADLAIIETRVYRGANVWSYDKAIHLVVDLGVLEEYPTNTHPRLHRPPARGAARPARALLLPRPSRRLRRAAPRGHLARPRRRARRAGAAAGRRPRHPARQDPRRSRDRRAATTSSSATSTSRWGSRPAGSPYAWSTTSSRPTPTSTSSDELDTFILRAQRTAFGPSTQAIIDEAVSRDIPWIRLNKHSLVQLGQGVHAKRIRATMTSETSSIAVDIASDKDLTTRLLGAAGLPVPKQESVRTADQAATVARRIGFPVVVKPLDGNHGRGVCLDLQRRGRRARGLPDRQGPVPPRLGDRRVVRHRQGLPVPDHRRARSPPSPSGCRRTSSVTAPARCSQLVDLTNADPRRGVGHEKILTRIKIDAAAEEVLADQGHTLDLGPRPRARWSSSRSPATCPPAASPSTAPSRPTPRTPRSPRRRPGWSGWTSPASTSSVPTSPSRCARPAARSARSTRLRASGCTPTRRSASRSSSPSRSWTCCSHPAPPAGSRSWPSPAPTARRPPAG